MTKARARQAARSWRRTCGSRRRDTEAFRLLEEAQRLARPFGPDQHRSHARLHPTVARGDLVGSGEQRRGGGQVAHADRQVARLDQRVQVARIAGEPAHHIAEIVRERSVERLHHRLRGQRKGRQGGNKRERGGREEKRLHGIDPATAQPG